MLRLKKVLERRVCVTLMMGQNVSKSVCVCVPQGLSQSPIGSPGVAGHETEAESKRLKTLRLRLLLGEEAEMCSS